MPVVDDLQHLNGAVLQDKQYGSPVIGCHGVYDDQSSAISVPDTNVSKLTSEDLSVSVVPATRLQEPDAGSIPCSGPMSHHEHPAVAAWKAGRLGLTFSGGGFLLSYHLGVLEALQGIGVIQPGLTPVAGASSGSLAAAAFHCRMAQPGGRAMACVLGLAAACRQVHHSHRMVPVTGEGGTRLRLGGLLRQQLMQELPDKAEGACSGRAAVAVTQALPVAQRIMVTEFHSREDLLDALTASCWIPRYSGPSLTCTFRGRACMDGGSLDLIPPLPWSSVRVPGPPVQATDQSRSMMVEQSMEAKGVEARAANDSTYTVKVCCFTEVNCLALPLPARKALLAGGFDICPGGALPLPHSSVKAPPPLHSKHSPAAPDSHLASTGHVASSATKVPGGGVASGGPALEAVLGAADLGALAVRPDHHGDQATRSAAQHPAPPQPTDTPQVAKWSSGVQAKHRDKLEADAAAAACCSGGLFRCRLPHVRRRHGGHEAHGAGRGVEGLPPSMRATTSAVEGCAGLKGEAQRTTAGAPAGQNVTPSPEQPGSDEAAAGAADPCGPGRLGSGSPARPLGARGQAGPWDRLAASVRRGLSTAVSRAREVEAAWEGQGSLGHQPHPSAAAAQQLGQQGARWPYSGRQMLLLALEPAGDAFLVWLHERGMADALAWAHTTGLAQAVCSHAALYQQPRCLALAPRHIQAEGIPAALPPCHYATEPGESQADISSRHRDAMARSAAALLACNPLYNPAGPQPEPGPHSTSVTPRGMLTPCLTSPTPGRWQEQEPGSTPALDTADMALGKKERGAGQQARAGHGVQQSCTTGSGCGAAGNEVAYSLVMGDTHEALARHDSMSREVPVSVLRMVARLGFGMTLKL